MKIITSMGSCDSTRIYEGSEKILLLKLRLKKLEQKKIL